MVRMAVGNDDNVDLLRLVAGFLQPLLELAHVRIAALAVAGIEQHPLGAGVHQRRDIDVIVGGRRHVVGPGEFRHRLGRLIFAEARMRRALQGPIENVDDLERPQLETIDTLHAPTRPRL